MSSTIGEEESRFVRVSWCGGGRRRQTLERDVEWSVSAAIGLWGTWYESRMEVRRGQLKKWSTVRDRSFLQWGPESGER